MNCYNLNQLIINFRFSGEHPLHVAVRLMREDVVFLCLVENDQSVSVNRIYFPSSNLYVRLLPLWQTLLQFLRITTVIRIIYLERNCLEKKIDFARTTKFWALPYVSDVDKSSQRSPSLMRDPQIEPLSKWNENRVITAEITIFQKGPIWGTSKGWEAQNFIIEAHSILVLTPSPLHDVFMSWFKPTEKSNFSISWRKSISSQTLFDSWFFFCDFQASGTR